VGCFKNWNAYWKNGMLAPVGISSFYNALVSSDFFQARLGGYRGKNIDIILYAW
jgi:hypothetical protein